MGRCRGSSPSPVPPTAVLTRAVDLIPRQENLVAIKAPITSAITPMPSWTFAPSVLSPINGVRWNMNRIGRPAANPAAKLPARNAKSCAIPRGLASMIGTSVGLAGSRLIAKASTRTVSHMAERLIPRAIVEPRGPSRATQITSPCDARGSLRCARRLPSRVEIDAIPRRRHADTAAAPGWSRCAAWQGFITLCVPRMPIHRPLGVTYDQALTIESKLWLIFVASAKPANMNSV